MKKEEEEVINRLSEVTDTYGSITCVFFKKYQILIINFIKTHKLCHSAIYKEVSYITRKKLQTN